MALESFKNRELKYVVLGDPQVGKTSLITSFINQYWDPELKVESFGTYHSILKSDKCENNQYQLSIYDTPGSDKWATLKDLIYPATNVFIICFSLVDSKSFENVTNKWLPSLQTYCDSVPVKNQPLIILVGTMTDKISENDIFKKDIDKLKDNGMINQYYECTAKKSYTIDQIFESSFELYLEKVQNYTVSSNLSPIGTVARMNEQQKEAMKLQLHYANSRHSQVTKSTLSDKAILNYMQKGLIVIHPFILCNLSTSSYDITLGEYYYQESNYEPGQSIFNPYSEKDVKRVWGEPRKAELASEWMSRTGGTLENISPTDKIIWLKPQETILGHTNEYVGGRRSVTTMMKARSSWGRCYVEICKDAGWGDVGYINRWTMEITNNSRYYSIPLVVGRRIGQIIFFDTDGTLTESTYEKLGKYQTASDLQTIQAEWSPSQMLPKMFKDKECQVKN